MLVLENARSAQRGLFAALGVAALAPTVAQARGGGGRRIYCCCCCGAGYDSLGRWPNILY